jgi:hypothetical protein
MQVVQESPNTTRSPFLDESSLRQLVSTNTSRRCYHTTAKILAANWNNGLETAKNTRRVTTQKGMRHTKHPIEQLFRTRQAQLHYKQLGGRHERFYIDIFFFSLPSLNGSTTVQMYTNDQGYTCVYPMKLKSQAHETLSTFISRHTSGSPKAW